MRRSTVALALAAATLDAQVPLPIVETEIVHVETVVTDRQGRAVRDLTREDFTLYVDGRPVPIVLFEPAPTAGFDRPTPVAPGETPSSAGGPTSDTPLVVLHLDADNLTVAGRQRALAGLGDWVAELMSRRHARVLVTTADRGVRLLAAVTSDPATVARALAAAASAPVHGMRRIADERTVREGVREVIEGAEANPFLTCVDVLRLAQSVVEAHARSREADQLNTIEGLAGLVAALGAVPGTKMLVYLTEGLEQRPALHLFHQLGEICAAASDMDRSALGSSMLHYDLSRPLQDLAARANAARVTLYPIDAAGLAAVSASDVSHESRRYTPTARNDSILRANLRAGPGILADETGGVAVFDHNRPVIGLAALERDLGSRYLLGFTPAAAADARRHTLRVEARKRGLSVRHRLSYWHAKEDDAHVRRSWAALLLGHEEDDLGALVDVASSGGERGAELSLRLRLPTARLGAEKAGAGRRGRLRIVIAVRGDGRAASVRQQAREKTIDIPMELDPGTAEPAWREVVVRLPFPQGEQVVAVGLRDLLGGGSTYRRLLVRP